MRSLFTYTMFSFLLWWTACDETGVPDSRESQLAMELNERFGLDVKEVPLGYSRYFGDYVAPVYYNNKLFALYLDENGDIKPRITEPLKPHGLQRVLCVMILRAELEEYRDEVEQLWLQMQDSINRIHASYALTKGHEEPIVQFENSNLIVSTTEISRNPDSFEIVSEVGDYLSNQGIDRNTHDILVVMDLDPDNPAGGWGDWASRTAHLGWIYDDSRDLSEKNFFGMAYAVYHHEIGHIWGWEHNWGDDPEEVFITNPELFGWTDYDNDGTIEIIDPKPFQ